MSTKAAKLAPIGIVAGTMGYFCWTHLDEPAPLVLAVKTAPKGADTLTSLLKPVVAPELNRDPFVPFQPNPPVAETKTAATTKPQGGGDKAKAAEPPPKPVLKPNLSGLVLNGTMIAGRNRTAVINGELFREGDKLAAAGAAGQPAHIAKVGVDRVVLRLGTETADLYYNVGQSLAADDTTGRQVAPSSNPAVAPPPTAEQGEKEAPAPPPDPDGERAND